MFGVYSIMNTTNGHIYVGSTARSFQERWRGHKTKLNLGKHSNIHLQNAWDRYGREVFIFDILQICQTPEECLEKEQFFLSIFFGQGCYNLRPNASNNLGYRVKDTTKIARANAEIRQHESYRQALSEAQSRRYSDPQIRQSQAERLKSFYSSSEAKERASDWKSDDWNITLVDPSGLEHHVTRNLAKFCRKHALHTGAIYSMVAGKRHVKSHKGWRLKKS